MFSKRDEGQGLVEIALVLSLVSVVAIVVLSFLGSNIAGIYNDVTATLRGEIAIVNDDDVGVTFIYDGGPFEEVDAAFAKVCSGQSSGTVVDISINDSNPNTYKFTVSGTELPSGWNLHGPYDTCP